MGKAFMYWSSKTRMVLLPGDGHTMELIFNDIDRQASFAQHFLWKDHFKRELVGLDACSLRQSQRLSIEE